MVKYTLYYFDARSRGEVTRLLFAAAGVSYEDKRISSDEEWAKYKPMMPLGQIPVLEVDGVKMCQSKAIERYLAREFGMEGKTNKEKYHIDMILETLDDTYRKFPFKEKDETKKEALKKEFLENSFPETLKKVEQFMIDYNGGDGFFAGQISVADLRLTVLADLFLPMKPDLFSGVPKLAALDKRVREVPNIKAWLEKRPKTKL